ncbi:hypothetical protein [Mariprofundus ferrooxydans]|uniref:Uncharacterized protein n=1 Tax=Mariprofundus ferrooxydans PV-1 TaxID=314345 RepID=Q0EWB1_9PROT|nr:hypothetical protein [Mariprofundus ferrooxydans]EAU53560.1 hypothetical protein SPV1_02943 [Mariprofundus ferrooxydans PV-1]
MARLIGCGTKNPHRTSRYRAWQSMRMLRRFTIPEIVATAEISDSNATKYIRALVASGHLRIARAKRHGSAGGHAIYAVANNSGPIQPVAGKGGVVFDPNSGKTFDPAEVSDE